MPSNDTWKLSAKCRTAGNPDQWYSKLNSGKELCAGCPVISECLTYAMENDERWGVWGGLTERERRQLRRRLNKFLSTIGTLKKEQSPDGAEHPIAS